MKIYLNLVSIFSICTFIVTFIPGFEKPDKRVKRGILFFGLGASALIPFLHLIFLNVNGNILDYIIRNKILSLICYLIGVIIYVKRFPEYIWPGKFCFIGSSHQLWHTLIVMAIIFTYLASLDAYNSRLNQAICPIRT